MHELSLAEAMVTQLEEVVQKDGAEKIVKIELELGAMSGVEREPFEFAFPIVAKGTCLQDAELVFEEVDVAIKCRECQNESSPQFPYMLCEKCNSTNVEILRGRDFRVKSMEVC